MNEFYTTEGIIIGRRDFLESDKIMTILTKDLGKIQVKAKGVRKILAKMAGHLELFNHVRLELVQGRTFYIVTGAQTIENYQAIKENFECLGILYYFSEIVAKFLEEGVAHTETFYFLLTALNRLKEKNVQNILLTIYFELNILSILGVKPEFIMCVGCRDVVVGHEFYFSGEKGGLLCESCGVDDIYSNPISEHAIKLIRLIVSRDFTFIERIAMDHAVPEEVRRINDFFFHHILGRDMKSKQFISV